MPTIPKIPLNTDLGLLLLRVSVGFLMLYSHGWGKLTNYGGLLEGFPDPIGLGVPVSVFLTVFAEFFCSLGLIFGLLTRLAVIPLAVTMLVALFVVHADDPWGKKEFVLLYLIPFITLLFTGAGRYSLDSILAERFGRKS